jgi:hypothetical protein
MNSTNDTSLTSGLWPTVEHTSVIRRKKMSSCSAYREKEWSKINNMKIHKNPSLEKIKVLGLNSARDKINS